jgi:hypothetical protein
MAYHAPTKIKVRALGYMNINVLELFSNEMERLI